MHKRVLLIPVLLLSLLAYSQTESPPPVQVQGSVVVRGSGPEDHDRYPEGALIVVLSASGERLAEARTNRVGWFQVAAPGAAVGDELRVRATYLDPETGLELRLAKRVRVAKDRYAYVFPMALPEPKDAELRRDQGVWYDATGKVKVEDPEGRFVAVWARAFDPEFDRPFFPGNYRDADGNKIKSNGFLFVTARDASGLQVTALEEPVTVYFSIPNTHRYYLRDITPGNGHYEVPMYFFDEARDAWVRQGTGVVVDAEHQPIPESDEKRVRTDPHYGKLFVRFQADRFFMWTVAHPLRPCKR